MLNEIEDNTVTLLTSKLESARVIGVQKGTAGIAQPAVYASAESGTFEKVTQAIWRHNVTLYVDIIFSNLRDQRSRREGINLILEGVAGLLLLNSLGLKIEPIKPKGWKNTTSPEMDELGLIAYSLELTTSYTLTRLNDETAGELLKVGLNYYLTPGDDAVDASDLVGMEGP
jgi:hypothetical protein